MSEAGGVAISSATGRSGARRLAFGLVLLAGIVPLLLAGCAQQQAGAAQLAANQTFTWPYYGGAKINYDETLDPAQTQLAEDAGTIDMIFAGLLSFNGNLQLQADAATSWAIDPSGTVYTFHLRPNMKFSDGTPLTAQDFAYSINRALDPQMCSNADVNSYGDNSVATCAQDFGQTYLSAVMGASAKKSSAVGSGSSGPSLIGAGDNAGLTVLDPQTLQIRLAQPAAYFLDALTYPTSYAVEKSLVENSAYAGGTWVAHLDNAGCSGPFKISSYGDGSQLTLVPNPYWEDAWGKQLTLTKVVRPLIDTQDDAYANYRKGQYDEVDVPLSDYDTASGQGDFQKLPGLTTRYFGFNVQKAPFANTGKIFLSVDGEQNKIDVGEVIRRAFALALNKQLIVDRVTNGSASPTNHIIPRGMPGYYPDLKNPLPDGTQSLTGNQGAAQKLLSSAQATCPSFVPSFDKEHAYCKYIAANNPQEIDVNVRSTKPTEVAIVTTAAQEWSSVLHLNVQVKEHSQTAYSNDLNAVDPNNPTRSANPYQIWSYGWQADYTDPADWLDVFFMTGGADNLPSGFSDKSVDSLLAKADVERNTDARMQLYNQAEQAIVDQVVWIPYQQESLLWRQRPWVRGFGFNSLGLMPDVNWANVLILQH